MAGGRRPPPLEGGTVHRTEYGLAWDDDRHGPLVIYFDRAEAGAVADLGGAVVLRRRVTVITTDWEIVGR